MKKINYLLFILIILTLTACGSTEYDKGIMMDTVEHGMTYESSENSLEKELIPDINRKVIYNAEVHLSTEEPIKLYEEVMNILYNYDGYIQGESITDFYVDIVIRVKSDDLKSFLHHIRTGSGEVGRYELTSDDITQNYSTFDSRRIALEAEHTRVLNLIEQAEDIDTLLELEKFRADVEQELNIINSKINNYDSLIDYSTVQIYIREENTKPTIKVAYGQEIVDTFLSSIDSLTEFVKGFILVIVAISPFLVIIVPLGLIIYYVTKKHKSKINNNNNFTKKEVNENSNNN
ncbi:DUF4349 domain-containing protein [Mycoplasmatota bacterium WC44]